MCCLSYGARDEIVQTCKKIAAEVVQGKTAIDDIDEVLLSNRMLTAYVLLLAFLSTVRGLSSLGAVLWYLFYFM